MLSASKRQLYPLCLAAIVALALPSLGISDTYSTTIDASILSLGGSNSGNYSFDTPVLADGDQYAITGSFGDKFPSGTFVGFYPTVTLIAGTDTTADTITVDLLQDFLDPGVTTWDGTYSEHIPFTLSPGVTANGQRLISTVDDPTEQSVGLITGGSASKSLSGLSGDELVTNYQLNFTFLDAPVGAAGSSPVPEPSQTIPVALGLVGLVVFQLRKLRSRSAGA